MELEKEPCQRVLDAELAALAHGDVAHAAVAAPHQGLTLTIVHFISRD